LKKEDFQLFDKGKLQVISKFTVEKADGHVVPMEVAATDPDAADEKKPGAPTANRFVAYLFDDLHSLRRSGASPRGGDKASGGDHAANGPGRGFYHVGAERARLYGR
jgi:hypothetical protein